MKRRDENKKDPGAPQAVRDFVAKVTHIAAHASNPLISFPIIILFLSAAHADWRVLLWPGNETLLERWDWDMSLS